MSANRDQVEDRFAQRRAQMVERQLRARGIRDERLLHAFDNVPRELFVEPELRELAYSDGPLPIGFGQTISQPFIVAAMIEAARIASSDHVLEVGAGSGYAAAILGEVAASVIAVERVPELAAAAAERLTRMGYANVRVVQGDGTLGWREEGPYDAILAAASGRQLPQSLIDQLAKGGRLVMPIGPPGSIQQLVAVRRAKEGMIDRRDLGAVRFVPLIGAEGWTEQD